MNTRELQWFFGTILTIFILFFATFDCVVRGPLYQVEEQMKYLIWLRQATSCEGIEDLNNKVRLLELKQYYLESKLEK